jgi:hypothetical protein
VVEGLIIVVGGIVAAGAMAWRAWAERRHTRLARFAKYPVARMPNHRLQLPLRTWLPLNFLVLAVTIAFGIVLIATHA